jgi:hypothetical protein
MMSVVRYYKLCLGLPLLLPVLVIAILPLVDKLAGPLTRPSVVQSVVALIVMSPIVGGIPYLLTIIPLLWYGWNRDASWYRNLSFVLPLIYAVVLGVSAAVFFTIDRKDPVLSNALNFSELGLLVGYPYVVLCHLGLLGLRRLGVIEQARTAASTPFASVPPVGW